eukprot:8202564-Alexandrium_andersonii.AAC.1
MLHRSRWASPGGSPRPSQGAQCPEKRLRGAEQLEQELQGCPRAQCGSAHGGAGTAQQAAA